MKFYCVIVLTLCSIFIQSQENKNQVVQILIEDLQSKDIDIRRKAIKSLSDMKSDAKAAIPLLLKIANDKDWYIKRSAAKCLGKIGIAAVKELIVLLKSNDDTKIELASFILVEMEEITAAETVIPVLINVLESTSNFSTRMNVFRTFAKMGNKSSSFLRAIIENSQKEDHEKAAFVQLLGNIRPVAKINVTFLIKTLKNISLRREAAQALGNMGHDAKIAIPALIDIVTNAGFLPLIGSIFAKIGIEEKHVLLLIKDIENKSSSAKDNILEILKSIGPQAEKTISVLIPMLQEKEHTSLTIKALSSIGIKAVPALIQATKHPHPLVREGAIIALAKMSPKAKNALATLTSALKDENRRVQRAAAIAISKISGNVQNQLELIIEASQDKDFTIALIAIEVLSTMKKHPQIFTVMIDIINSNKNSIFGLPMGPAFEFLQQAGKDAKIAVPHLIKLLGVKWPRNESEIIRTLAAIGPDAADAEPVLRKILTKKSPYKRSPYIKTAALKALARVSSNSLSLVPLFITALEEYDSHRITSISQALAEMVKANPMVREKLLTLINDPHKFVRQGIMLAFIFAAIKPANEKTKSTDIKLKSIKKLIVLLTKGLEDPEWEVRAAAAMGLSFFCSSDAIEANVALQKCLHDKNIEMRSAAAVAIGKINLDTEKAITVLVADIESPVAFIRMRALEALGILQEKSVAAIPAIIKAAQNPNRNTRLQALQVLGQIKERPDLSLPILTKALASSDESTRSQAANSLGKFETKATSAIPALIKTLQDTSWLVRKRALTALGEIEAKTAIADIENIMFNDPEGIVRQEAQTVLDSFK